MNRSVQSESQQQREKEQPHSDCSVRINLSSSFENSSSEKEWQWTGMRLRKIIPSEFQMVLCCAKNRMRGIGHCRKGEQSHNGGPFWQPFLHPFQPLTRNLQNETSRAVLAGREAAQRRTHLFPNVPWFCRSKMKGVDAGRKKGHTIAHPFASN